MQMSNNKLQEALEQVVRDEEGQHEKAMHLAGEGNSQALVVPSGLDKAPSNTAQPVRVQPLPAN
jgi:hypothetical protein